MRCGIDRRRRDGSEEGQKVTSADTGRHRMAGHLGGATIPLHRGPSALTPVLARARQWDRRENDRAPVHCEEKVMDINIPDSNVVRIAVDLACRAPSVHNSQPWRWRYTEGCLD